MSGEMSFSLLKLDPDQDQNAILQTGFKVLDHTIFNQYVQASDAGDLVTFPLPSKRTDFDKTDELKSATPATFYKGDVTGVLINDVIFDLKSQARTFVRALYKGTFVDMSASKTMFMQLFPDVWAGLHKLPPARLQEDGATLASTTLQILKAFNWKDDGAGTNDMHWTYLRRWFYLLGKRWSSRLPHLTDKLQLANASTYETRIVEIIECMMIQVLYDFIRDNLISKRLDASNFDAVQDPLAKLYMQELKPVVLSGISGYTEYRTDFINASLINNGTLDDSIYEYKTQYVVSSLALEIARQMFGVGEFDIHGDQGLFGLFYNGVSPSSGGLYDTHGSNSWCLGLNIALSIDILEDDREWWTELQYCINRQTHYTWTDLKAFIKDFATDYNVLDSVRGIIDNDAYKAYRRHFNFSEYAVPLTAEAPRGVTDIVNTSGSVYVSNATTKMLGTIWPYIMLQGLMPSRSVLYFNQDWTENEIKYDLLYGILVDLDTSASWQDHRYNYSRYRICSIVDSKNPDDMKCLVTSDSPALRFESIADVLAVAGTYGHYSESTAAKYQSALVTVMPSFWQVEQGPRPKGNVGAYPVKIVNLEYPEVLRSLADIAFGKMSVSPSKPAPEASESKPTPDHSSPAQDEDDEEV
jgi:hypothetical protein